jgi:hypothetical protein
LAEISALAKARAMSVRARRAGLALLALILAAAFAPAPAEAAFQRMLLAPGCYAIAPGGHYDVAAYCLDQALAAPASGALLSYAPQRYGSAAVRLGSGRSLSLQEALEKGLLQIQGLGDKATVRLVNPGLEKIELCITTPTVLMGNGQFFTADLAKTYGKIAALVAADKTSSAETPDAAHDKLQRAIWDAVNAADQDLTDALTRRMLSGIVVPRPPPNPQGLVPSLTHCAGEAAEVEVCAGQ